MSLKYRNVSGCAKPLRKEWFICDIYTRISEGASL